MGSTGRDEGDAHGRLSPDQVTATLRSLFAESPDAIGVSSRGIVTVVNAELVRLFGYSHESELEGMAVMDLLAPSSQDMFAQIARRRETDQDAPALYILRGARRDGTEFDLQVRSTTYLLDGEPYALALFRDVSGAPQAARPLGQGEEFYRALFEASTAVELLISPSSGRIIDANEAAAAFYGWPLEVLRTMRISDINTLSAAEITAEMEAARSGRRRYFRFRHRTAGGEVRHVEVHSGPVELHGEQLLLSIIHDVTERDALEEQLLRSQRLEAAGRLASGVAHDFNNVLTVMLNTSEVMGRLAPEGSPLRPYAEDMAYAAQRAAELTQSLLAVGRQQKMSPEDLSLNEVVKRMGGLLQRTLGPNITVHREITDPLPHVRADPRKMEDVLMNLALNARDAMPSGGRLTLGTGFLTVRELDTVPVPAGRWVTLGVADDGDGIDDETRRHIFEPFFTTKQAGSGLGLATVHGIVAQSHGHITVDSGTGRGTRFTIYLPPASA